jgi:preprotein translocase subunit SecG
MIYGVLVFLYVVVCLFLVAVVLLQTGKRADLAGAFGGGGSQTAFGSRGAANLLTRLTTGAAVGFMLLALVLSVYTRRDSGRTVLDDIEPAGSSSLPGVEEVLEEPAIEPGQEVPAEPTEALPPTSEAGESGATGATGQP